MARVLITGYMIRMPLAGNVLAFAQYLAGFDRLGHDVGYVEESGWPQSCFDPALNHMTEDPVPGMRRSCRILAQLGVTVPLWYVNRESGRRYGENAEALDEWVRTCDLLLVIGGVSWLEEFATARRIALVDLDPMFTQAGKFAIEGLDRYQVLFTYGTNIGRNGCNIPLLERTWHTLVPPVLTEAWQAVSAKSPPDREPRLTTIANWSAYGSVTYQGDTYAQKDVEFEKLLDLPRGTACRLEIAAAGMPAETQRRFRHAGWHIRPAAEVSQGFQEYAAYVGGSAGEFSVAKHGYVRSRSGWISDRTVCYLAAGRPVVVQCTAARVPIGQGMLTFHDYATACAAIEDLLARYDLHAKRAAELARCCFDYRVVLPALLDRALSSGEAR